MFFKKHPSAVVVKQPCEHTMQNALTPYIGMKVHPLIKNI